MNSSDDAIDLLRIRMAAKPRFNRWRSARNVAVIAFAGLIVFLAIIGAIHVAAMFL